MKKDSIMEKIRAGEFGRTRLIVVLVCAIIFAVILSLTVLSVFASGDESTYYFDSTASKNGNGTQSKPFNTLKSLEGLELAPGSKILLKRGSIFKEQLRLVGVSGTEAQPITISTYGDSPAIPRIDGCDTVGEGVVYIENCNWITLSNLEICDTATYEADRRGILICATSNNAESAIFSGITLDSLYVHDINGLSDGGELSDTSLKTGGIQVWTDGIARFDRLKISDCFIKDVSGVGIAIRGSLSEQVSPYSDVFSSKAHTNVEISYNDISYVGGAAVYAENLLGGVIEHNIASETAADFDSTDTFATAYVYGTKIQYNEGYLNRSSSGSAFGAGEQSREVIWQYNYSHDNAGGFFGSAKNSSDAHTVRYNLSVNDNGTLCDDNGSGSQIYNNTFICGKDTSPVILQTSNGGKLSYYNNLVFNESSSASIYAPTAVGADSEISNNLIYNNDGGDISGLDAFKLINSDGLYVDPLMAGGVGESVAARAGIESAVLSQLKPTSLALNQGLEVEGVEADLFGNAYSRSIGFYCGSGNSAPEADYELSAEDLEEYAYSDIKVYRDLVYGTATTYKGGTKTLTLDIYSALDCDNVNRPLVVMIHGGGFRSDSFKEQSYAIKISTLLARKGYVVASINYRTRDGADMPTKADAAPALMDAAEDTNTAVEWLRGQGGVYGFNPDYIFVAGGSAGGATAVCYAFADDERNFNKSGIVAVANLWGGPRDVFAECYDSDFSQDDKFPTIFIHGTGDTTMEYTHSLDTYERMVASGIVASWNPIAGAEHSMSGYDDTYEMTVGLMNEFFTARLADKIEADGGYTQPPVRVENADNVTEPLVSTKEKIYPNADTFIYSHNAGKYANYSAETSLFVYDSSNSLYLRKTILRFDTEADTEESYLHETVLHFTVTGKTGISESAPMNLEIYGLPDNYWFVDEITWKNTPDFSEKVYIGTISVSGTGDYSIDVTNYVYDVRQNGGRTVTFLLESNESPTSGKRIEMDSYESGENAPYLECSYREQGVAVHTVKIQTDENGSVDISETTVVNGGSLAVNLAPKAGYAVQNAVVDTADLGVEAKINGNQVIISGVVADTVVTVYFAKDGSIIVPTDSTTVRFNSPTTPIVNATDTSIDGNINPLYVCTKGEKNGGNNDANRVAWLNFDISDYDLNGKRLIFEIYCYKVVEFSGATMPVDVYATTFSDWSSDSFAWNDQPFAGGLHYGEEIYETSYGATKIGTFNVKKASQWYSVDVTDYVQALRMSGFTTFSLVLVDSDFTKTTPIARFVSTHGTAASGGVSLAPRITAEGGSSAGSNDPIDLNLNVSGESNGSVSGYTNVKKNSSVVLDVEADDGYSARVTVDGVERRVYDGKLALFGADESTEIEISFVKEHTVSVECDGHSRANTNVTNVLDGDKITIVFALDAGYKPIVRIDGIQQTLTGNTLTLTVNKDVVVSVESVKIIE